MSEQSLVGTWRLVSYQAQDEDGNVTYPFGQDVDGFLIYTPDGHVAAQLGKANRSGAIEGRWADASADAIAAAARDYYAYCGTYHVGREEVVHTVAVSLIPNWIGSDQVRRFSFQGDRLTLATPPLPIDGRLQVATLVWERA